MISGTGGELSSTHSLAALAPVVDHTVREAYRNLLNLPVPEQLYKLLDSRPEQREPHPTTQDC